MQDSMKASRSGVRKKLRSQFLTGILVVVPIAIVIIILVWLLGLIDRVMEPLIGAVVGHQVRTVMSLVVMIGLIYVVGVIASNIGGKKLIGWAESLFFGKIPVVRQIYNGMKQILQAFSTPMDAESGFVAVVLVEFPTKGMKTIGLVTNEAYEESGEKLLYVFIPTAPNPTSGYLEIMKESDVIRTDMSIDDAIKMVVSAGKVSPKGVTDTLSSKAWTI